MYNLLIPLSLQHEIRSEEFIISMFAKTVFYCSAIGVLKYLMHCRKIEEQSETIPLLQKCCTRTHGRRRWSWWPPGAWSEWWTQTVCQKNRRSCTYYRQLITVRGRGACIKNRLFLLCEFKYKLLPIHAWRESIFLIINYVYNLKMFTKF